MASPASSAMKSRVFHAIAAVVLFTLYPILSLVASNASQLAPMSAARSAAVLLLASLLALLAARWALGGWERATMLVVGLQILFFSYGHVYDLMRTVELGGVLIGRHRYLFGLWGAAGLVWAAVVLRLKSSPRLTWLLSVGAVLVTLPMLSLGISGIQSVLAGQSNAATPESAPSYAAGQTFPDIYYIILDGYGRADVLADLYGIDNQAFLEALAERGFYVAGEARSNYSQTLQSLASSLNMRYLDDLAAKLGPESVNRAPLQELVQDSEVRRYLETLGYQTVAFETGHQPTELRDAAFYFAPHYEELNLTPSTIGTLPINEFEGLLAGTTLLRPALDELSRREGLAVQMLSFPFQKHRQRVIFTLQSLVNAARLNGPQFVFAHVVCPHPPFVFSAPGEEFVPIGTFTMQDGGCCTREEYLRGYRGQIQAVNALMGEAIDAILAESEAPPIIIVQADHGPSAYLDAQQPLRSDMRERLSILSAYFVPEAAEAELYPSITPVNTFGLVLEAVFGRAHDLLEDKSYFAPGARPYDFTLVTESVQRP
jgi:hypothetical protein